MTKSRSKSSINKSRSTTRKKSPAQVIAQKEKLLLRKQKLARSTLIKKQKAELKQFRKQAAILKKKNIAFVKLNIKTLEKSNYRNRVINFLKKTGIFEGRAHIQSVNKEEARILKERGYIIKNRKIILPNSAEKGERLIKLDGQKTRVIQGYDADQGEYIRDIVDYQSWEEFLNNLRSKWDYFEGNGHQLAFRLYGNLSRETYNDIDSRIRKWNEYGNRSQDFSKHIAEEWRETIQHIEIYKTTLNKYIKEDDIREKRLERNRRRKAKKSYAIQKSNILSTQGKKQYDLIIKKESAARSQRRRSQKVRKRK